MCNERERYTKEEIPKIIDSEFSKLKDYCRKVELLKTKRSGDISKKAFKCFNRYFQKLNEVVTYLLDIASISKEIEHTIIKELKRRIECNKMNTTNNRSNNVLELLLDSIQSNSQFQ